MTGNDDQTASILATEAVLHSLVVILVKRGSLTYDEARDVYEQALLLLETAQSTAPEDSVLKLARERIEGHLRKPTQRGKEPR